MGKLYKSVSFVYLSLFGKMTTKILNLKNYPCTSPFRSCIYHCLIKLIFYVDDALNEFYKINYSDHCCRLRRNHKGPKLDRTRLCKNWTGHCPQRCGLWWICFQKFHFAPNDFILMFGLNQKSFLGITFSKNYIRVHIFWIIH